MPCCAAVNCHNRSENGFRMFKYPAVSDPERRRTWISNTKRANWIPTESSRLCEVRLLNVVSSI